VDERVRNLQRQAAFGDAEAAELLNELVDRLGMDRYSWRPIAIPTPPEGLEDRHEDLPESVRLPHRFYVAARDGDTYGTACGRCIRQSCWENRGRRGRSWKRSRKTQYRTR
jgi:hypothetical protein